MSTIKSFPIIKAELSNNNLSSDNTPNHTTSRTKNGNLKPLSSKAPPFPNLKQKQVQTQQPSIAEIEKLIGAGVFRDRDTERESELEKTLFDKMLTNSFGEEEGSVEKQLREAGEWIIHKTETTSQSNGNFI
ncbi:hypothetical protein LIER_36650 [Lithospermum erythrorhizon]|uniref:Uncharacterized protein n=1 Tax=Lithospermum erythrorhizon TaxID=34254 RepID=A0AAV3P8T4_LITER